MQEGGLSFINKPRNINNEATQQLSIYVAQAERSTPTSNLNKNPQHTERESYNFLLCVTLVEAREDGQEQNATAAAVELRKAPTTSAWFIVSVKLRCLWIQI